MSYGGYLRNCLIEYALCALMCLGLGLNLVQGFHIADVLAENAALVALATAVPLLAPFLAAYSKRSLMVGIPAIVVGVVAYSFALAQLTPTSLFAETYENTSLMFMVLLPVPFCTYLLSRTRSGLSALFIIGCILCGVIQFLYGKDLVAATVLFMAACAVLCLMKGSGVLSSQIPSLAMAASLAAIAALVSVCAFVFIIAPLNPPTHELKLITEYYSLEEVHVSGVLSFLHQRNDALNSNKQDEETQQSSQTGDDEQDAEGGSDTQDGGDDEQLGEGSYDPVTVGDPLSAIRYLQEHWWTVLFVFLLVVAAWVAVVVVRRTMRKRRVERWRSRGTRGEYEAVFEYACAALERAELIDRGSKTPLELAEASQDTIRAFEEKARGSKADDEHASGQVGEREREAAFSRLASTFSRIRYGGVEPTPDELADAEAYAAMVPKRLSKTVGPIRYLRHFFHV